MDQTVRIKEKNAITEGVIWKQLLRFCLPIMAGTLFQQLYNAADVVVVGRFVGTAALAAVGGSAAVIINLVVNCFVGLASGVTVLVARSYGAGDAAEMKRVQDTAVVLSLAIGLALTVLGIVCTPAALTLLDTPAEVFADSALYLRIYFGGVLFVLLYNIGSAILRARGDSRRPLIYLIVCCAVNVGLDVLLVIGFGMGVAGVAIATVTAQAISAALTLRALAQEKDCGLNLKKIGFYPEAFSHMMQIGLPAGLQSLMNSISGMIMAAAVNGLGTYAIAGNTAYAKLDAIFWMVSGGFSVSIATFVGQNYGAGKKERVRRSIQVCLLLDLIASGALSLLFLLFGHRMLYLFTSDEAVIAESIHVIRAIAPYYMIVAFYEILTSALRGLGDVLAPSIINIVGLCGVRAGWILFVALPVCPDLYHIILSCPISWAVTAAATVAYFFLRMKSGKQEVFCKSAECGPV